MLEGWSEVGLLEIWVGGALRLVPLESDRFSIGSGSANDVVLEDRGVSRLHAVLERFPAGWTLCDLGSTNGLFVNGERVFGSVVLRPGDRIRMGATDLLYRGTEVDASEPTSAVVDPPTLTPREREVLLALCAPLADGDLFCEPASVHEIAVQLTVSEDAIKKHMVRLYGKFDVRDGGGKRRARLANRALATGAVTMGDLRA